MWIRKLGLAAALLIPLGACSLTGSWGGSCGYAACDDFREQVKTSGFASGLTYVQAAWYAPGGYVSSGSASLKFDGGGRGAVTRVLARQEFFPQSMGACPWDEASCSGIIIANHGKATVSYETTDVNGDGYISGIGNAACGLNGGGIATYNTGYAQNDPRNPMPLAATFLDQSTCVDPDPVFVGMAYETSWGAYFAWGSIGVNQDPAGVNWLSRMPLRVQQDFINSIDTEDFQTITAPNGRPYSVLRVQVTKVRVGGRSYTPVGTYLNFYKGQRNLLWDPQSAGWKLTAAWMANAFEKAQARGTTPRWSIELNGSVVLGQEQMPPGVLLRAPTVEGLRAVATSNLRRD